jgi:hypothetical protein
VLTCSETAAANSSGLAPESSLAQTYNERQDKPSFTQISFLNKSQQVETRKLIKSPRTTSGTKRLCIIPEAHFGWCKVCKCTFNLLSHLQFTHIFKIFLEQIA